MRKLNFVLVLVLLLVVLLSVGPGAVLAQDPQPPDAPTPTEPTIVETTRLEWVETEDGKRQLVPVSSIESMQTVSIPSSSLQKSDASPLSRATITMWRALEWSSFPGDRVWVHAGGSTSTDVVAEKLYIWIDHFYRTPGHSWHGVGSNWKQKENTTTTGECWTGSTLFSNGFEHAAQGDHQAKISGQWYIYNDQWGPQRIIP